LEVASRMADEFPDGVWVFELAAVNDPVAVPDAVPAVLFLTQQPGKSLAGIVGETVAPMIAAGLTRLRT
jgi:predicted ATPase